jgi:hypothetical protein
MRFLDEMLRYAKLTMSAFKVVGILAIRDKVR